MTKEPEKKNVRGTFDQRKLRFVIVCVIHII